MQLIETTSAIVMPSIANGGADSATARYMVTATDQIGAGSVGIGTATMNTASVGTRAWCSVVPSNTPVYVANVVRDATAARVSAKFKVFMASPTVAGTYVVRVTPAITGGSGTLQSSSVDITITVSAPACTVNCSAATAANSWSQVSYGTAAQGGLAASVPYASIVQEADSVVVVSSALSSGASVQAANIYVYQQNADLDMDQTTPASGSGLESLTATISGPGLLSYGSTATGSSAVGRSITVPAGNYIHVWNDGTPGIATITVTGVTSGRTYASKSVSFYGTATKVVATLVGTSVVNGGVVGIYNGYIKAQALDVNGVVNRAATAALIMTGSDTNLITARDLAPDSAPATNYAKQATNGFYAVWNLNTASSTATRLSTTKNGTFTLTIGQGGLTSIVGSPVASATQAIDSATAVSVRLSNGISKIALSFDKASYSVSSPATVTLTVYDSSGALAGTRTSDSVLAAAPTNALSMTGSSLALTSGTYTWTVTMPAIETTTVITAIAGTSATDAAQLVTVSASAIVSNPTKDAADAATDAALEATDAAYAAQDAAQLAAESADAATAAAEAATAAAEAATAAVEDLATKVAGLFADLQKQITTLANVVAKIAKKVKA